MNMELSIKLEASKPIGATEYKVEALMPVGRVKHESQDFTI